MVQPYDEPYDEMAAGMAGRGHLRVSRADREDTIDMLKAAFVQGGLTKDELEGRFGQALGSWTWAELAAVTADIPDGPVRLTAGQERSERSLGCEPAHEHVGAGVRALLALSVLAALIATPIAVLAGQTGNGALSVSSPDTQACQTFNTWLQWSAVYPASHNAWLLDSAVTAAAQGPDIGLLGDLEGLQQAVLQTGVSTMQWLPDSGQYPAQNSVENAAISVSADCSTYGY